VLLNNLGGKGPNKNQAEEMRLGGSPSKGTSSAGTSSTGEPFDISITTDRADYNSKNPSRDNGLWKDEFGVVYVFSNGNNGLTGHFKFSFVKPGTNEPVILSEVHLTVFDIDGASGGEEFSASKDHTGYYLDPKTSLTTTVLADGRTEFKGTKTLDAKTGLANGPLSMDEEQRGGSVMFIYKNKASFELDFGRTYKGGPSGLVFAFRSVMDQQCKA